MRHISHIIIHCSATPQDMDVDISDVNRWHKERGFTKVGYHYFVKRDGLVQIGRTLNEAGAHSKGYNDNSIGVCYAGGVDKDGNPQDNRTEAQKEALQGIVRTLKDKWPDAEVLGHCDLPKVAKDCPCFDVRAEFP